MIRAYVAIGTNYQCDIMLPSAVSVLRQRYQRLQLSRVYRTTAHSGQTEDFDNAVLAFDTEQTIAQLQCQLKQIEQAHGRGHLPGCCLDLDLLLYGDISDSSVPLPHPDIEKHDYIRQALAEHHATF